MLDERLTMPEIGQRVESTRQIASCMHRLCGRTTSELVHVFFLDGAGRLSWSETLARGSERSVLLDIRNILSTALRVDAKALIVGHNHPSGLSRPSQHDIVGTKRLRAVCEPLGIALIDHVIVTATDIFSFKAERLL